MDIIISHYTEGQPCSCSIITQSVNKTPKAVSLGKASQQAPGSLLPTEPLLTEKASSTKTVINGEGGMRSRREAGSGEYLPPIPGTGPAFYELPMSSEADTGAGWGGDLREVWEPHPKENCQPSWDRREGSPGRDALYPLFTQGLGPHI